MIERAIAAINAADLPPTTRANALALLALAHPDNGHLVIEWEQLLAAFRISSIGRARRHLGLLDEAGIIHYSTNGTVYVTFKAWIPAESRAHARKSTKNVTESARPRADSDAGDPGGAQPDARGRADSDVPRAEIDVPRADSDADLPRAVSQSVSLITNDPDLETDRLTSATGPNAKPPPPRISDREYQRSLALLIDADVGLDPHSAAMIARQHKFNWLLCQVMTYRRQLAEGKVKGPGALLTRINGQFACTIIPADHKTALYKRHMAPVDAEAERRNKYIPAEYADVIIG